MNETDISQNTDYQNPTSNENKQTVLPSLSLPKGGGAINGIGEKFTTNPVTGTGSMTIPIYASPGRSGFGPQLSLSYDSGDGNGPFGLGWSLSLPAITRKTAKGLPKYDDNGGDKELDVFILSGSEDLVPVLEESGEEWTKYETVREVNGVAYQIHRYRPRIEGLFARIEKWTNTESGETHWRSISKDNIVTLYGKTQNSRISDPENPLHVFSWLISESYDDKGNAMVYEYKQEDSQGIDESLLHEKNRTDKTRSSNRYIKRIKYGNKKPYYRDQKNDELSDRKDWLFEVVFDYSDGHYAEDNKGQPTFISAKENKPWPTRQDSFSRYRAGFEIRTYRLCHCVLVFHHFPDELGVDDYLVKSTEFEYNETPTASFITHVTQSGFVIKQDKKYLKKSLPPLEFEYSHATIQEDIHEIDDQSLENLPVGLDGVQYRWVDLEGEGISGILSEHGRGRWHYKNNITTSISLGEDNNDKPPFVVQFAPEKIISTIPSTADLSRQQLMDLTGNGKIDLVQFDGDLSGYFERTDNGEWKSFVPFTSMPNISWQDPNLKFVDLTGDGHADILLTEDYAFTWYRSLAEKGFESSKSIRQTFDEEKGPRLVLSDSSQSVYLADLSGDGLTDLVRIRNGEICYWPNLGYGRFGAKVSMNNAPWFDVLDLFDQKRIRLADIDGSGITDIIYLGDGDSVKVYFNEAGNRWSSARTIKQFPPIDDLSSVMVADLYGNGTTCLVWSSPLSDHTRQQMRYIDLMGGTKPHLLISSKNNMGSETHIKYVSSTKFYLADKIAGKPWITKLPFPVQCVNSVIVTDHISEVIFTSSYSYHHGFFDEIEREFRGFGCVDQLDTETFSKFKLHSGSNVVEEKLHQPPILTKSWFHTGAFYNNQNVLSQYFSEYYKNKDFTEYPLVETIFPDGLSSQEYHEALRACKGIMLRNEVYALDGTENETHPYTITQTISEIRLIQPQNMNKHAAFIVIPRETISYSYEQNPKDPRISHRLILDIDELGFVKKSASVIYPRVVPNVSLPNKIQSEQAQRYITFNEINYTNDVDSDDILRLRASFEEKSYELTGISIPTSDFLRKDDINQAINSAQLISFEAIATNGLRKRLLNQTRKLFQKNDLSGPLPLGKMESLGMFYRSYRLAFTRSLVKLHYGDAISDEMFSDNGYVHSKGDLNWWIPSGIFIYPVNPQNYFYFPTSFNDSLDTTIALKHDVYNLLLEQIIDDIGNKISVKNDYRTLTSWEFTDINFNRSAVVTDEIGIVVKNVTYGKEGEGDTLDDPTTKIEYDLFNWKNNGKPNYLHTFSRERHGDDNPRWQEQYIYFDGGGSNIMTKIQAEPGLAKKWNSETQQVETVDTSPQIRWIGNGRTIINNKGSPIKQYDPYFSTTHEFENESELVETGYSSILHYDPLGRNYQTDLPNDTFTKIKFDIWHAKSYDANDTVLDSQWYVQNGSPNPDDPEPNDPKTRAAWLAAKHADTPNIAHTDSLGRTIYKIIDNGIKGKYHTQTESDLTGSHSKVYDTHDRQVSEQFTNIVGALVYSFTAEKGKQWFFYDVMGKLIQIWDSNNHFFRITYDKLHRPISTTSKENDEETVLFRLVYGDSHTNATEKNLHGKAYQIYDQSGVTTFEKFDFKGNLLHIEKRLANINNRTMNWNILDDLTDIGEIQTNTEPFLDDEIFSSTITFDALNRPIQAKLPDKTIIIPHFNEANFLDSLYAQINGAGDPVPFLKNQNYDAKGQRQFASYGNGTITKYTYDPKTFRLVNLLTKLERDNDSKSIQNLTYTFDPVGNITEFVDDAQQTHFFRNEVVKPQSRFQYDAIYQLIQATGRELASINGMPTNNDLEVIENLPHPNDSTAVRTYSEQYEYDEIGNILRIQHNASKGDWTRRYRYSYQDDPDDNTNRLVATSLPSDNSTSYSATYVHDFYGNMTKMPCLSSLEWNTLDQLQTIDLGGGGNVFYIYGTSGQRIRKVHERNDTVRTERIYLGSIEIYRKWIGDSLKFERKTLHISDDTGRIAQVDTKTIDIDNRESEPVDVPIIRYQLTNHLGSTVIETNDTGQVILYDEYHPYGTTAYHSGKSGVTLSLKRYRYSGKERDEETGLYYFGGRYYVPWLGRWASSDPAGFVSGYNLYRYCSNNPIMFHDPNGMQEQSSTIQVQLGYETAILKSKEPLTEPAEVIEATRRGGYNVPENPTVKFIDIAWHISWDSSSSATGAALTSGGIETIKAHPEGETIFVPENFDQEKIDSMNRRSKSSRDLGIRSEGTAPSGKSKRTHDIRTANQHHVDEFRRTLDPETQRRLRRFGGDLDIDHTIELQYIIRGRGDVVHPHEHRPQNRSENRSQGSSARHANSRQIQAGIVEDQPTGAFVKESDVGRTINQKGFRTGMRGIGYAMIGAGPVFSFIGASQIDNDVVRYSGQTLAVGEAAGSASYAYGRIIQGGGARGSSAGLRTMAIGGRIAGGFGGAGQALTSSYSAYGYYQGGDYAGVLIHGLAAVGGVALIAAAFVTSPAWATGLAVFGIATGLAALGFELGRWGGFF